VSRLEKISTSSTSVNRVERFFSQLDLANFDRLDWSSLESTTWWPLCM